MFHGQMSREIVCEVIGVPTRVRGADGTDDLLTPARVPVLFGDVVPQLCLREAKLGTERAGVGEGGLHTVTLPTIEQVYIHRVYIIPVLPRAHVYTIENIYIVH